MAFQTDDEYHGILKPCFQISPSVELKEVPSTGEEFLLSVIRERMNCAEITKCNMDISQFAKYQNYFVEVEPEFTVPEKLKPTIEWQNMQLADFSDTRKHFFHIKQTSRKKILEREPFCAREWRLFVKHLEPTVSIALALRSKLVDLGIGSIESMLKHVPPGESINHRTGQWIYTLLTCVTHPLLTETRVVIRALAKRLREIRSHIDPESENAAEAVMPLNIFICLLSRYFENQDLADN